MLLAIDRSLATASVALFQGTECVGALEEAPQAQGRLLRSASRHPWEGLLDELLAKAGVPLSAIDSFTIGLGPGSFSGIRSALAFAKGLALPGENPIWGVTSAAGMAWEVFRGDAEAERVFVVGDARRGTLWIAECSRAMELRMECLPVEEGVALLEAHPDAPRVSPDGARLAALGLGLGPMQVPGGRPLAQALGEVALAFPALKQSTPVPLYLHPAVRVG